MDFPRHVLLLTLAVAGLGGCVSRQDGPAEGAGPLPVAMSEEPAAAEASSSSAVASAAVPPPASPSPPSSPASSPPSPPPAAAEAPSASERITVLGRSFTGLWKVNSPKRLGMDVGLFSGVRIRYSGETGDRDLCELRQTGSALDARCLRLARTASGSVDGDSITLRSWIGPATLVLKASAEARGVLVGTIGGGALGAQLTGGVPFRATRIAAPEGTRSGAADGPSAPLLRAVLADVAAGRLTAGRYAPEAAARLGKDLDDLHAAQASLGPIETVAYLDRLLPRHPYDPTEHPLEVYRVDYARGSRLCGISPGPPAAVADFLCR